MKPEHRNAVGVSRTRESRKPLPNKALRSQTATEFDAPRKISAQRSIRFWHRGFPVGAHRHERQEQRDRASVSEAAG